MYKKNNNITFFWIAIIISIIGIAVISGFFIANLGKKLSVDKTTEATYIEQKYETNSDNEKIYKPIYHYVVNDKEYTCDASFVVNSEEITSGTVHYNSNNPQKCMIDYNYSHFNSIYFLLIVDVFLLFCLVLLIKSIKSIKKKSNMIEYLKGNGEIVKNVPYELKTIGTIPEDINDTIIADCFESVVGAIYLDQGFECAKKFIDNIVIPFIREKHEFMKDYKSKLQEMVQTDKKSLEYTVISESGPAHDKNFIVEVKIDGIVYGTGMGKSKKEAEQNAALDAFNKSVK